MPGCAMNEKCCGTCRFARHKVYKTSPIECQLRKARNILAQPTYRPPHGIFIESWKSRTDYCDQWEGNDGKETEATP